MPETKYRGQEVPHEWMSMPQTLDIVNVATAIYASCFYSLIGYGMGVSVLNWTGPLAFLGMLATAQFGRCLLMYAYLAAWFVACIVQLFLRDRTQHSMYRGYPILCKLLPITEPQAHVLEALVIGGLGIALQDTDAHISTFFMAGGVSLLIRECLDRAKQRQLQQQRQDALIEQQQMYG